MAFQPSYEFVPPTFDGKKIHDSFMMFTSTHRFLQAMLIGVIEEGGNTFDFMCRLFQVFHSLSIDFTYNNNYGIITSRREDNAYTSRAHSIYLNIIHECNGLVFHVDKSNVIVIDVMPVSYSTGISGYNYHVDMGLTNCNYIITPIIDGTVVNIYYNNFEQRWCISTTKGLNVTSYTWIGPSTYAEIICQLLQKYEVKATLDADGNLEVDWDKNCSYTFGFHYDDFHPMLNDNPWFNISDFIDGTNNFMWYIGSYSKKSCSHALANPAFSNIPTRKFVNLTEEKIVDFASLMKFIEQKPAYGYILIGNGAVHPLYRNVIIKSPTYRKLEDIFYNVPKELNNNNRYLFIMFRAYLVPKYKSFVDAHRKNILFTDKIPKFINNLLDHTLECYYKPAVPLAETPVVSAIDPENMMRRNELAEIIISSIDKKFITTDKELFKNIVLGYINCGTNAMLYTEYFPFFDSYEHV